MITRCLAVFGISLAVTGLSLVGAVNATAQTVGGTVTSGETGETLPGVNVMVKGTDQGTLTNADGRYSLNVPSLQDTLVISMVGYEPREVAINGRNVVDVELAFQVIQGEELIVTGYRVQARGAVTGSVSSVNSTEFAEIPADNLSNALAGRLSGVTITQDAGTPGRESDMSIRAVGTFNNASPLYVIDGVVSDKFAFDGLSASEVESVSILKDGAAASVYGSRAANGVILVTTKRGLTGAPQFSYSGTVGMQEPTSIPGSLTAFQHAKAINDALQYNNIPQTDARYYTQDELDYFQNNSWNWVDELWKEPVNTQHALSMTGGSDAVRYYLGGSYNYGSGSFDNLSFQRVTARGNVDVDLTDNLTASADFSTERRDRHGPSWGGDDWGHQDLYKALALRTSMVPPYLNGQAVGNWVEWHPGVVIDNGAGYDKRDWSSFNTRLRLDYQVPFISGLTANLTYNRYVREEHRKQFNLPYEMTLFETLGGNGHIIGDQAEGIRPREASEFLMRRQDRHNNYQLNAQLNFNRQFGDHNIDAVFVYEQAEADTVWFEARRDEFISSGIDQFIGGSNAPEDSRVDGSQLQSARISYVGLLGYNYSNRYILEGSFRYDGSAVFAPEHRWGFFPSVSAAWRISEEPWFRAGFFDDLMVRASYGVLGNDDVGRFQWQQSFEIEPGAIFGDPTMGLTQGTIANRAITWEKSRSYNVGLDSWFWHRRMSLKLDVFYRNTYDILGSRQRAIPSTFGATLPDENYQEINSHGFEIELGYNGSFGASSTPVAYRIRGNVGYATNEIVRLDEAENIRPYQSRIGRPVDAVFGYVATDIIRTQEDLEALPDGYTILGLEPQLGMLNYRDLRGPNSDDPDGQITPDDQAWLADYDSEAPPVTFGLTLGASWRSWSFDALFQGVAGHEHLMHTNGRDLQARAEESSYGYWSDSWTPDNPDGAYPGYRGTHYRTRYPESTFWLRGASFVRLKNLNLSYEVPEAIAGRLGVNQMRVFLNGTNLAMLYDQIGDWDFDPEAENIRSYPIMRTLALGLTVGL